MTRIKPEDMATLQQATAVKTIAETAVAELEEMQVAHCINEAANTGEMRAVYCRPISDTLLETLTASGYKVYPQYPSAKKGDGYIISWADAE